MIKSWSFALVATIALVGCNKDDTDETDTDVQDTDTQDTDDTDDTDVDPVYTSLTGNVSYQQTIDGVLACDLDVDIVSTGAYTGDCADCDFGFNVAATVTRDDSTDACRHLQSYRALTFQAGEVDGSWSEGAMSDPWIGFSTLVVQPGWFGYAWYYDATIAGATYSYMYEGEAYNSAYTRSIAGTYAYYVPGYQYYDTYYEPYTSEVYETGWTSTFDGTTLNFEVTMEGEVEDWLLGETCENAIGDDADSLPDAAGMTGTLRCDGTKADVWTFNVDTTGTVHLALDSTDETTVGDAFFAILDSNGCLVSTVDDSVACSGQAMGSDTDTDTTGAGPLSWCAAWQGDLPAGTYKLAAWTSSYECDGIDLTDTPDATWSYTVSGSGISDLTLASDETDAFATHVVSTTAVGTATVE